MVGIWSWSELWEVSSNLENSKFIDRLIRLPQPNSLNANILHPYEENLKNNQFGQRTTSILGHKDLIFISTSSKTGISPEKFKDLVPNIQNYGAIYVFRTMTDFFVPLGIEPFKTNTNQSILLKFHFSDKKNPKGFVEIFINKILVGKVNSCFSQQLAKNMKIIQGGGVYGPYNGKILAINSQGFHH